MKTKELIQLLQEADPTGEEEVVCHNLSVNDVVNLPAYWDGTAQISIRENSRIVKCKHKRTGRKIQLYTDSFNDLMWDRDFKIDYSELSEQDQIDFKNQHDEIRRKAIACDYELELESFIEWVFKKCQPLLDDSEDEIKVLAKTFYDNNLSPNDKIDEDIPILGESHHTRRCKQWDRTIKVSYNNQGFIIEKA